jgi:hypothetical protein
MNVVCNSFLLLDSGDLGVLPSETGSFVEVAGCVGRRVVNPGDPRPPRTKVPADPPPEWPPSGIRAPASEPQASAVKRGSDTAVSTVKTKKQCTAQGKSEPAPLPVKALKDSSLPWNRLVAMATFAKQDIANVVDEHGVATAEARRGLVAMLTQYINDRDKQPLLISGRAGVPKVFMVSDSKHASKHNPARPNTDVKWFYWENGNGEEQRGVWGGTGGRRGHRARRTRRGHQHWSRQRRGLPSQPTADVHCRTSRRVAIFDQLHHSSHRQSQQQRAHWCGSDWECCI